MSVGAAGQTQPPWEAGEQTYLSFCWWVVMPRKSLFLFLPWLEVCHSETWKAVLCSPCEKLLVPGASLLQHSSGSPSLQGRDWLGLLCPLPTDPLGSPDFLCILMIGCKCALFWYSFLSLQNHPSAVISSVLPNNWNKGLFRFLSLQNNNC